MIFSWPFLITIWTSTYSFNRRWTLRTLNNSLSILGFLEMFLTLINKIQGLAYIILPLLSNSLVE